MKNTDVLAADAAGAAELFAGERGRTARPKASASISGFSNVKGSQSSSLRFSHSGIASA